MAFSIAAHSTKPVSSRVDLLALLVRAGERPAAVDDALGGLLWRCASEEEFTGKEGQVVSLHTHGKIAAQRVLAIGIGKDEGADRTLEQLRNAAARAVKLAKAAGAKSLAMTVPSGTDAAALQALAEGASLGAYVFDRYKQEKKPLKLSKVELLVDGKPARAMAEAIALGAEIAAAVCSARDLVN